MCSSPFSPFDCQDFQTHFVTVWPKKALDLLRSSRTMLVFGGQPSKGDGDPTLQDDVEDEMARLEAIERLEAKERELLSQRSDAQPAEELRGAPAIPRARGRHPKARRPGGPSPETPRADTEYRARQARTDRVGLAGPRHERDPLARRVGSGRKGGSPPPDAGRPAGEADPPREMASGQLDFSPGPHAHGRRRVRGRPQPERRGPPSPRVQAAHGRPGGGGPNPKPSSDVLQRPERARVADAAEQQARDIQQALGMDNEAARGLEADLYDPEVSRYSDASGRTLRGRDPADLASRASREAAGPFSDPTHPLGPMPSLLAERFDLGGSVVLGEVPAGGRALREGAPSPWAARDALRRARRVKGEEANGPGVRSPPRRARGWRPPRRGRRVRSAPGAAGARRGATIPRRGRPPNRGGGGRRPPARKAPPLASGGAGQHDGGRGQHPLGAAKVPRDVHPRADVHEAVGLREDRARRGGDGEPAGAGGLRGLARRDARGRGPGEAGKV